MKTLSAVVFLLMVSGFFSNLSAQSQNNSSPTSDADRAIIASWSEQANQQEEARIESDRIILPIVDERNAMCAFMRVYRMKRDIPGSDATRPAGYTTCVGSSRFTMKSSAKPQAELTPMESIEAK
jgi:hypothetical protein